jgi:hypothetical protein
VRRPLKKVSGTLRARSNFGKLALLESSSCWRVPDTFFNTLLAPPRLSGSGNNTARLTPTARQKKNPGISVTLVAES